MPKVIQAGTERRGITEKLEPYEVVDAFMLDLANTNILGYRKPQIRASSMPFCPILFTLSEGHGEVNYTSQHYFSVGTALHDVVQKYGAESRVGQATLWGDWECTDCKRVVQAQLQPAELCDCGGSHLRRWQYVEVTIEYLGISGHIDTILCVKWHKNPKKRKYIIVDYKTSAAVMGKMDPNKYPFRGNVLQISLYAFVMKEKYGLDIVGFSLCYIQRDKPVRTPRDYVQIHQRWTKKNHANMGRKLAWVSKTAPLAQEIWTKLYDKQTMPSKAEIQALVDSRPCKSMESWEGWMKAGWEREYEAKDRVCSALGVCIAGGKACTTYFTELMEDMIPK